jgi:hypothetical protein
MRRSTIVLVVLFAALGLLYWYMQRPGNAIKQALATSTVTAPALQSNLLSPAQGPVNRITIQSADGKTVTLNKAGGIWLVTADYEAPANQNFADAIADNLMSLQMVTNLEKSPDLVESIGLNNPTYTISLILQDGSPYTLKIGTATVTDSGYYALANDGSIGVIDKYKIEMLTALISEPPFLQTATPLPAPATETPTSAFVPETTSTPEVTPTTKP